MEKERFLEAEETASRLVETLKELHEEATSYQTANQALHTVQEKLLQLIDTTKNLSINSHEVINTLKEIGTPQLQEKLISLEDDINTHFKRIGVILQDTKNAIETKIKNSANDLDERICITTENIETFINEKVGLIDKNISIIHEIIEKNLKEYQRATDIKLNEHKSYIIDRLNTSKEEINLNLRKLKILFLISISGIFISLLLNLYQILK